MRDIKFRAMDIYKNFHYGSLIKPDSGSAIIYESESDKEYRVQPQTVGQYTGMKDKNNIEVYEGDILRIESYEPEYYRSSSQFCEFIRKVDKTMYGEIVCGVFDKDDYDLVEIVGNIHENPELLKEDRR